MEQKTMVRLNSGKCPVCLNQNCVLVQWNGVVARYNCRGCGEHSFSGSSLNYLQGPRFQRLERARIAHGLYKMEKPEYVVNPYFIDDLLKATKLADGVECLNNLVLHLGRCTGPGEEQIHEGGNLHAAIGVASDDIASWVASEAQSSGLISIRAGSLLNWYRLTHPGWDRYRALMLTAAGSTHAFMAMDFRDAEVRALFVDHLQPAVAQTGFSLRTTDSDQKTAGLIDNRMRVDIRTSRFVVCDLSNGNRGAYWEAGFAEGIDKPVFYICKQSVHESADKEIKPHFDTAHQTIIQWDPGNLGRAMAELKAMIRATLPSEARMQDEPSED